MTREMSELTYFWEPGGDGDLDIRDPWIVSTLDGDGDRETPRERQGLSIRRDFNRNHC